MFKKISKMFEIPSAWRTEEPRKKTETWVDELNKFPRKITLKTDSRREQPLFYEARIIDWEENAYLGGVTFEVAMRVLLVELRLDMFSRKFPRKIIFEMKSDGSLGAFYEVRVIDWDETRYFRIVSLDVVKKVLGDFSSHVGGRKFSF